MCSISEKNISNWISTLLPNRLCLLIRSQRFLEAKSEVFVFAAKVVEIYIYISVMSAARWEWVLNWSLSVEQLCPLEHFRHLFWTYTSCHGLVNFHVFSYMFFSFNVVRVPQPENSLIQDQYPWHWASPWCGKWALCILGAFLEFVDFGGDVWFVSESTVGNTSIYCL